MLHKRENVFVTLTILFLLAILAYQPFMYQDTLGEKDSFRMINGIIDSITNRDPFRSPLLYNCTISYGYYALLYLFAPIFKTNLALVIPFMNYINVISATLIIIPLFFLVRRYWGTTAAILSNILLIFVPSWWNVSLYGHPMTQAILFMFVGLALIGSRSQLTSLKASRWKLIGLDILIIVAFSLCLMFRFDAILMFPLITACLLLERYSFKMVVFRSILFGFLPFAIFIVFKSILLDMTIVNALFTTFQRISKAPGYLESKVSFDLVRALALWGLACHPLYLLAFYISCCHISYKRNYLALFFILPVFILNLSWLINPSPARHFIYMAPVLAVGIAIWLSGAPWGITFPAKHNRILRPIPLAILFMVVGLVSSELMYPIVRAHYPWKIAPQNYSTRAYIRSIFINKYYSEKYFHDASRFGQDLLKIEPKRRPILVVADALPVILQLQLLSEYVWIEKKEVYSASASWRVYLVENEYNKFIFVARGDWMKLFLETDEYNEDNGYYLTIDPYNPKFAALDTLAMSKNFEVLSISD